MFEKVNPMHPDKCADRIAGALVDMAYLCNKNPKIAVEVLIGHGKAFILSETSEHLDYAEVKKVVSRIANIFDVTYIEAPQDAHLARNQARSVRCGDNGIFKGCCVTSEQKELTLMVRNLFFIFPSDGKFIINTLPHKNIIICQSGVICNEEIKALIRDWYKSTDYQLNEDFLTINPIGSWTGGLDVDCGATNRKLGSDMGDAVTGGGLHGKDLSKADVSVNIYCHLKAQELGHPFETHCAIGDEYVDGKPYHEIVEIARDYINKLGGFEKFAEWGLIR